MGVQTFAVIVNGTLLVFGAAVFQIDFPGFFEGNGSIGFNPQSNLSLFLFCLISRLSEADGGVSPKGLPLTVNPVD